MKYNIYKIVRKRIIRYFLVCVFFLVFGFVLKDINLSYSSLYSNHIYNDKYNYPYLNNSYYDSIIFDYISNIDNGYDGITYDIDYINNYINVFFVKSKDGSLEYDNILLYDNKIISLVSYLDVSEDILLYNIKENIYKSFKVSLNDLMIDDIKFRIKKGGIDLYINDINIYLDNNILIEENNTYDGIIADKYISFTFDDGPSIYTNKIMDILDKYNYKATFFEVGNMINRYPEVTKEVVSRGYEVGNHTTDHSNLNRLNEAKIRSKIEGNNTIFNELTGENMLLVRCPYGNSNKRVKNVIDNPIIYWSVDSRDWESRNTDKIVNLVKENTKDGDIVLFHDLYPTTLEAIEVLAEYFYLNGYRIVSVSELFQIKGKELVSHNVHYNAR